MAFHSNHFSTPVAFLIGLKISLMQRSNIMAKCKHWIIKTAMRTFPVAAQNSHLIVNLYLDIRGFDSLH